MNRRLIATAVAVPILLASVFGAAPAFAAEDDSADPASTVVAAPETSNPVEPVEDTATIDEGSTDSLAGSPSPEKADASSTAQPEPSQDIAPSTPIANSDDDAASALASATAASAAPIRVAPAASPLGRPGPEETGYTTCWNLFPDVPGIDPYDARTWPGGGTCAPLEDRRTPWSASVHAWNTSTNQSIVSGFSDPNAGGSSGSKWSPTGDAARWGENGVNSPEDANLAIEPGQTIRIMYDFTIQMPTPDTRSIIGLDGNPGVRSIPQINFRMPVSEGAYQDAIPSNWDGVRLSASDQSCSSPELNSVAGQKLLVWCSIDATIDPTHTLDEWQKVRGRALIFQPTFTYELQWVYDGAPGPWTSRPLGTPTYARIDASQIWLPTATNKTFRVKAADTLTVTPGGLLVGAEWSQGNVEDLDTYITDIPEGGTLTDEGNLEFTSDQIGSYDFDYYLEDPASGIRSKSAHGDIEVYDLPVVTPSDPQPVVPVTVEAGSLSTPPATVLAHTGSDPLRDLPIGILSASAVALGIALLLRKLQRRRHTAQGGTR